MFKKNIKSTSEKVYLDLEAEFLYDYLFFSSNLRFLQSSENSYKNYEHNKFGRGICFVNLFETYQKSLEDLGAVLLSFKRRFNPDKKCKYQKNFNVLETPIIYSLMNYKPGDALISIAGKNTSEIENNVNLKIFNQININILYPDFEYNSWRAEITKNILSFSTDQRKRLKMFNKIKHGGVIMSNAQIFKSNQPLGPAAIYVHPDNDSKNPLVLHSFKYEEDEFILMKSGIMSVRKIIRDLIAGYLIHYYPDFIKEKGLSSGLELLKKVEK